MNSLLLLRQIKKDIKPAGLTLWESIVIKNMKWFSLEDLQNTSEIIYPTFLLEYLPDILNGKYPEKPIEIDLTQ